VSTLPPGLAARLDPVCDRFESGWLAGSRPRLEDFLPQVEEPDRPALLCELLALEMDYRARQGERPQKDEYQGRLPEYTSILDKAFPSSSTGVDGSADSTPLVTVARPAALTPPAPRPAATTAPVPAAQAPDPWATVEGGGAGAPEVGHVAVPRTGRYEIEGEIGRGGMGAVLRARDGKLNRSLAVKVLLEKHRGSPEFERRFLEEAQITGQLQHPGIPPVHEVGRLPDGRPFFAMKLIRGQTLAQLLEARSAPGDGLPRFLAIFEQVGQTLAYAHSRGVIHRDLKPLNVMVGAFGEVQVMDWGLAKVLSAEPSAATTDHPEEGAVATVRTESVGLTTQAGAKMGTPAYMAPEQARGEVDRLDERSDVFGLGAVLCEILTGQPPYGGGVREDVFRLAASGNMEAAFARLESSGSDTDLMQLCKECLAPQVEDRPRDAGEVAQRVTVYQTKVQERLRQSELARGAAQVRAAEERKRRKLAVGLAAAVLSWILVGGGASIWFLQRRLQERAELGPAVSAAVDIATALRQQVRWNEARAILDAARLRVGESGPADLRRRLEQAVADLELAHDLDGIRQRRATLVDNDLADRSADRDYEVAFRAVGLWQEGDREEVVAARVRDSDIRAELVAALDDWANTRIDWPRRTWVLGVASRAGSDEGSARFRDPRVWGNADALRQLVAEADGKSLSPQALTTIGLLLRAANLDAVPWWKQAYRHHPNDFWINYYLGMALRHARAPAEAIGYYRAAVAIRPDSVAAHITLANALHDNALKDRTVPEARQLEEAITEYRLALALAPEVALAHDNYGLALYHKGELEEAIKAYRRAIELDPRFAPAHTSLALALKDNNKPDEAIQECRQALALAPDDIVARNNLGLLLRNKGQLDEAIGEFRRVLELDPRQATTYKNLGIALTDKRQWREAATAFQKAAELEPEDLNVHGSLAEALQQQGRFAEARAALGRVAELQQRQGLLRERERTLEAMQRSDRLAGFDQKLATVLKGEAQPASVEERLALAQFCENPKRFFAAAARFYAEAFEVQPGLATDLKAAHRYHAAGDAALAGCGRGEDAGPLDDAVRARLRQQALDWLKADLALWVKLAEDDPANGGKVLQHAMQHWQTNAEFASVRDPEALTKLPPAERGDWQALWNEVAALRRKGQP
jgi:serine/threonine-protein kinase